MPRIIEYTENEGSAQTSANTLINLINSSKNQTAGLAGFQIKTIVVCSVSAVIFGEASFMLATPLLGPGLSFIAGAGFGFMGGLIHRWKTDMREAREACCEYPGLMEHHLKQVDPASLKRMTFAEWKQGLSCDFVSQGFAIAALYAASPAIQRIRELREEEIIVAAAARFTNVE